MMTGTGARDNRARTDTITQLDLTTTQTLLKSPDLLHSPEWDDPLTVPHQ